MAAEALTPDRILDAAEQVLRRFGPAKTTVVDVARALDVSHGAVYRHFPTKAALRDAVTARWLHGVSGPMRRVAEGPEPAPRRLAGWLTALRAVKRDKVGRDPEMFAAYSALAAEAREPVAAHVADLISQLERIVADGLAAGVFVAPSGARAAAEAILDATTRFHHPAHAAEWSDPRQDAKFEAVLALVLEGLAAAASGSRRGGDGGRS